VSPRYLKPDLSHLRLMCLHPRGHNPWAVAAFENPHFPKFAASQLVECLQIFPMPFGK